MRQTFKKYFIPHEENDYQPHILRWKSVCVLGCIILFAEIIFLGERYIAAPQANILQSVLVAQTNESRQDANEGVLRVNPLLEEAARLKADDMATKGYFAHTSPEGLSPWYWFVKVGYDFSAAGENLAVNFSDSSDVMRAWLASPDHRANILNGNFSEIGIGTATGSYEGHAAVFVVQLFGVPAPAAPPVSIARAAGAAPRAKTSVVPAAKNPAVVAPSPVSSSTAAVSVAQKNNASGSAPEVLGSSEIAGSPSVLENIFGSPHRTADQVLLAFGALVALALFLDIFIKIRIQHLRVIANGAALLVFITGLFFLNNLAFLSSARIF